MGILEIHFHDSEFSWSVNPGSGEERSLSFGTGERSETTDGGTRRSGTGSAGRPSMGPKLRSAAVLALVVAGGIAFNRVRARRARQAAEREAAEQASNGPFSLLRSR